MTVDYSAPLETPRRVQNVEPSEAHTTALAASLVVKASEGTLLTVNGYNSKGSAQFIQVHNAAALPSDTAVPIIVFTAAASSNFSYTLDNAGQTFSTGIVVCNSSTAATKTIGSADCWFNVRYR